MDRPKIARCAFCQVEFQQSKFRGDCCSVACANRRRRVRPERKPCERCGAVFAPAKVTSRFCSVSCGTKSPLTDAERFWSRVDKSGECWDWIGALTADGYGNMSFMGKNQRTHRVAWFLEHGEWPTLQVLHKCDRPCCSRASHLFLGTHADNMLDMASKGRSYHRKLTPAQVREARSRCSAGETHLAVAQSLGVKRESIRDIMSGKKWKWLH
jgi:hypothetical protein